jgi:Transposase IS116/IS110/IS902 family
LPNLVARNSIGQTGAAQLLLTAGDNPERLRSEASFAALCGVSPVPASSGKTVRHRLNPGGDRAANSALHIIAIGRLRTDQRTKHYVARRIAEGHSKLDAIRALKRYLAREVFTSRSSCSVRGKSTPLESPLDKQKGVRGLQGGFKRSSQHPNVGGCDDPSKASIPPFWTDAAAVTGTAASSEAI